MLTIVIPPKVSEEYDSKNNKFIYKIIHEAVTLQMEHSLISISKWESKWHKPFLASEISGEKLLDYIKCMTLTHNIDDEAYNRLTDQNIKSIIDYINDPMTATTFSKKENVKPNRETITSEVIYYWMVELKIPVEFEKWHINRLLTLIRVCEIKNTPPKKMSKKDVMANNAALNAARRKKYNSKG